MFNYCTHWSVNTPRYVVSIAIMSLLDEWMIHSKIHMEEAWTVSVYAYEHMDEAWTVSECLCLRVFKRQESHNTSQISNAICYKKISSLSWKELKYDWCNLKFYCLSDPLFNRKNAFKVTLTLVVCPSIFNSFHLINTSTVQKILASVECRKSVYQRLSVNPLETGNFDVKFNMFICSFYY